MRRRAPAAPAARTRVVAFHKPRGCVTTHRDELGRETVYERLRARLPGPLRVIDWHAVGRLDLDTTGLLLFTNDGALLAHATHPATHVRKRYRVLAKGLLDEPTLQRLRDGVPLTGGLGTSAPAGVVHVGYQTATTWLDIELREGKNRQVRRMLLAVGSQVIRLHRTHVGGVALDLDEGDARLLSDAEVRAGLGYEPRVIAA